MAPRRQPMMSWSAVRSFLRRKFPLEYDDDEGIRLVWQFDGVAQPLWLHSVRALDAPHVMVMCPVGAESDVPPRDAVRHNRGGSADCGRRCLPDRRQQAGAHDLRRRHEIGLQGDLLQLLHGKAFTMQFGPRRFRRRSASVSCTSA